MTGMLWPVSCKHKYLNTVKYKYSVNTNTNTWSEATGTVGSVADKGSERDAGSAER